MDKSNTSNKLVEIINSAFKKIFLGVWTVIFTSIFIYCLHYFKFSYNKHIWQHLNLPVNNINIGLFDFYSEHYDFLLLLIFLLIALNILCLYGICFILEILRDKRKRLKSKAFFQLWGWITIAFWPLVFILQVLFTKYSLPPYSSILTFLLISSGCTYLLRKDDSNDLQRKDSLFENFSMTFSMLYLLFVFSLGNISMITWLSKYQGEKEGKRIEKTILNNLKNEIFLIQYSPELIGLKKVDNSIELLFLNKNKTKINNNKDSLIKPFY